MAKKKVEIISPPPNFEAGEGKMIALNSAVSQIERIYGKGTIRVPVLRFFIRWMSHQLYVETR